MKKRLKRAWRWVRKLQPIYWFRSRFVNRYHLVDIRGEDGYTWGYTDPCNKMWLACWKVLREFVELEFPDVGKLTIHDYYDLSEDGRPIDHRCHRAWKDRGECDCPVRDWWEGEKEGIEFQLADQKEIWDLYVWWTEGRKREHDELDALLEGVDVGFDVVDGNRLSSRIRNEDPRWLAWKKLYWELEEKDEAMFLRLVKVRPRLWT